jgi:hypothetical protein
MTSVISVNNKSTTPLGAGKTYIGKWDSVLESSTAVILVNSDVATVLTIYQSVDKGITYTEVKPIPSGVYTDFFSITSPFIYFTLKNNTVTDMTFLQFQIIYRQGSVFSLPLPVTIDSRNRDEVWGGSSVVTDGVSGVVDLTGSNRQNLSVYGSASVTCDLALQFSTDGITFYTSQYSVTVTGGQTFGYTIPCAASYVRLKRTDVGAASVLTVIVEAV